MADPKRLWRALKMPKNTPKHRDPAIHPWARMQSTPRKFSACPACATPISEHVLALERVVLDAIGNFHSIQDCQQHQARIREASALLNSPEGAAILKASRKANRRKPLTPP